MNKIFVGGTIVSGKNILWRLLDGHSSLISNSMHSNLGFFILRPDCKEFFLRKRAVLSKEAEGFVPMCKISYSTGEVASVDIGRFFHALYSFSNYKSLYSASKGSSMFVHLKEGLVNRLPFIFDIEGFEKSLEKKIFTEKKIFSEEDIIDAIYSSYIENLGDKKNNSYLDKTNFVDTLENGIERVLILLKKMPEAKVIIMMRDVESLLYANAVRTMSIQGKVNVDSLAFKRTLFNQKDFEKKMNIFNHQIDKLQNSDKDVFFVNFNELILDTEKVMHKLAKFLGIEYEPILVIPSINGEVINIDNYQIIGSINDDPHNHLSKSDIDLLEYIVYGFNKSYSVLKNISILLSAIKWRVLHSAVIEISKPLKFFLPEALYSKLKTFYKDRRKYE